LRAKSPLHQRSPSPTPPKKVETLFILAEHEKEYQRYIAENLPGLLEQSGLVLGSRSSILCDAASAVVEEIFNEPSSRENV